MDFRQNQSTNSRPATPGAPATSSQKPSASHGDTRKWFNILNVVLLFCVTVLLVSLVFGFVSGGGSSSTNEKKYVDGKKYQAVFLNNGQVYFGNIASLNDKYVRLTNIYYLTQNTATNAQGQTTTDGNYSLVKLGCQQIHDPYDQMLINRDQVTFWENLQDNGKVVTSINQFKKQNPNGPDCSQTSTQTQASNTSGSNTQSTGTGTTNTTTNSTTNSTKQ